MPGEQHESDADQGARLGNDSENMVRSWNVQERKDTRDQSAGGTVHRAQE
jgi:hypothetical protein